MPANEISALQRRLTDAACYSGPIDGRATAATARAIEACPSQVPQLRIETGMHIAKIWRIGVDPQCRLAATASDDKTVRLWSLPEGRLLRTLRWPIGSGDGGKANAAVISPDGHFVVVGGWDAAFDPLGSTFISVFEIASGALVARFGGFEQPVTYLAYSADGHWLAAMLTSGGVRMIDATAWRTVGADKAYGDYGSGATFGPDGRLYTASYDGKIRRYGPGPQFRKEAEVKVRNRHQIFSVAIDPTGSRVAVGFENAPSVEIYDAPSLAFRAAADTAGVTDELSNVAWSQDGTRLIAAGSYSVHGTAVAVLFDRDGRRDGPEAPVADGDVFNLQRCGAGFAFSTGDPSFGLLDRSGAVRLRRSGTIIDMRGKLGEAFTISADARRVRFGSDYGGRAPVLFDLASATLSQVLGSSPPLAAPRLTGLPVASWDDEFRPTFAGKPIELNDHERSRSMAIRPDARGFALGSDYALSAYDARGHRLWKQPTPGSVWGTNISADGRIIVAAYDDGTIRWHRWSDGKELLTLFVNAATKAWVAWTPSGYYSASPGGEDMIGWHLNRGWRQAADFFPASRFHDKYARPEVVERVLDTLDETEAIRQADAARPVETKPDTAPLIERLPPVISILAPIDGAVVAGADTRIDFRVRSPSGLSIDHVDALIDGRPAEGARGLAPLTGPAGCSVGDKGQFRDADSVSECQGSLVLQLPPGTSTVSLTARAGGKTSDVAKLRLTRREEASPVEMLKPKLYALVIGISAYSNHDYTLAYPAKDAQDFAASLENQKGGLYRDVVVRRLTNGDATAAAIKDGLDWLDKQVTSRDVGLVFMAGHGTLDERERFYFLAADSDVSRLRATAVAREDIADALDALAGKALLFLDSCHAGAIGSAGGRRSTFDVNVVVNELAKAERGVVMFAASTGRQVSMENDSWRNGAFTKAVVEGLGAAGSKGRADFRGDGRITTSELDAYVAERVKALTGGAQSPVMIRPATVSDYPFALAR